MSFGDLLWSLLIIYFIFFYFMMLFRIIGDLFADEGASGWVKTGWIVFLLVVPFLAIFVYLLVRGRGMTERAIAHAQAMNAAQTAYIREAAGTASGDPVAQIASAHELLTSGAITQPEFDTIKAKALV